MRRRSRRRRRQTMRRAYTVYSAGLILAVALTAAGQTRPSTSTPQQPSAATLEDDSLKMPPGNADHGRYIAERVAMCVECHPGRDSMGRILDSERYRGG